MAASFDASKNCLLALALLRGPGAISSSDCGVGLGAAALASLLGGRSPCASQATILAARRNSAASGGSAAARTREPLAARPGHFPARAKSVIYLFMAGGPEPARAL